MTYQEKLQTPEWKAKRLPILERAKNCCEDCFKASKEAGWLEVHHCFYITGLEPWQYPDDLLIALCPDCHESRQKQEQAAQIQFAKAMRLMKPSQLADAVWVFLHMAYIRPWSPALEGVAQ